MNDTADDTYDIETTTLPENEKIDITKSNIWL